MCDCDALVDHHWVDHWVCCLHLKRCVCAPYDHHWVEHWVNFEDCLHLCWEDPGCQSLSNNHWVQGAGFWGRSDVLFCP